MSHLVFATALILAVTRSFAVAQLGFDWIWPPPFGLVDSQKSIAPCGGFNGTHDLVTHYLNQLRWNQSAQQISYMTRVTPTLNVTDVSAKWTELYPVVQAAMDDESGVNNQFCIPVHQPAGVDWSTTIFQLIASTPAGIIFACSRVSFQPTANQSYSQACNTPIKGNNTVSNITDANLVSAAGLLPGATATPSSSSSSSQAPTASSSGETSVPVSSHKKHLSGGAIAGIVIGSVVGACALLGLLFLLFRRGHKTPTSGPKELHADSSTSRSDVVTNGNTGAGRRVSELLAVVPTELGAEDSTRAELPGNEKLLRPELPGYSEQEGETGAGILPEKAPQTRSPEAAAVSPVGSSPHNEARSPVSTLVERKHFPSP